MDRSATGSLICLANIHATWLWIYFYDSRRANGFYPLHQNPLLYAIPCIGFIYSVLRVQVQGHCLMILNTPSAIAGGTIVCNLALFLFLAVPHGLASA